MKHDINPITILALAMLLSACATNEEHQAMTSSHSVQTEERAAVTPQGDAATTISIRKMSATVKDVDSTSRMLTLVGPQGNAITLQVGEEVKNLAQVQPGDEVIVEYYVGLVAHISPSGDAPQDVSVTEAMVRAAPGQRPAGAVGGAVTALVTIDHIDIARNVVHFKGPSGKTQIVEVMKPEFRAMLKKLKPGDQVSLTYFEALAVNVVPAKK